MELFPPLVAQVMLVLVAVIGLMSLVAGAYNWSIIINGRKKVKKIDELEQEVKKLQREVKDLKSRLSADERKAEERAEAAAAPVRPAAPQEVWSDFVNDFNNLAASMDVPKALQACENFAHTYHLSFLVCIDHAARENGMVSPKFAPVSQIGQSSYWGWAVPNTGGAFVVVPNPLKPYDGKLHTEGGMKETFASNYETGVCKELQVKLPAKFQNRNGNWKIIAPGVIRVK